MACVWLSHCLSFDTSWLLFADLKSHWLHNDTEYSKTSQTRGMFPNSFEKDVIIHIAHSSIYFQMLLVRQSHSRFKENINLPIIPDTLSGNENKIYNYIFFLVWEKVSWWVDKVLCYQVYLVVSGLRIASLLREDAGKVSDKNKHWMCCLLFF